MATLAQLESSLDASRNSATQIAGELEALGLSCATLAEGMHAAIVLKEHGKLDQAGAVFQRLQASWPDDESLAYEHIQFLRRAKQEDAADEKLIGLVQQGMRGDNIWRECVLRALADPAAEASRSRLLPALLLAVSRSASPYNLATVNYFASIDAAAVLDTLQRSEFQTLQTTHEQCLQAIRARTPFCLLRLGDGDGAFLHPAGGSADQEALFLAHRQFFTSRWYDDGALAVDPGFLAAATELRSRLLEADIIGIPQPDWLQHEMRMRNMRSLVNCLQLARLADSLGLGPSGRLSTTTVAVDLEYRGLVSEMLREAGPISLITSHASLGGRLEAAGRAQVRQTIPIPPAHSDRGQTGYVLQASHFRDAFGAVNRAIDDTIRPGDLVLVAAGFLGKLYALRVKQRGGIALDIGSLADLWMGHMTRPAFRGFPGMRLGICPEISR